MRSGRTASAMLRPIRWTEDRKSARSSRARPSSGGSSEYRGLRIFAPPGLHARVAELAREQFPARARILDLGAGTGALSMRLADAGFRVTAADLLPDNFQAQEAAQFLPADLDGEFLLGLEGSFAGVVAVEILEHLEHPRGFLRRIAALLAPGGRLIVTTPNPASPVSKARFVRTGHFQWFTDEDRRALGHVSPFTPRLLCDAIDSAGLRMASLDSFGDPRERVNGWWKLLLLARIVALLARGSGDPDGDLLIAVAEKPREEART